MSKINYAVIGASYGDEGKGRTVDYLAKKLIEDKGIPPEDILCVRFSGSNNAAHTVYIDENTSHVFKLLGSASFRNVSTFLSQYVYIDLVTLCREMREFKKVFPEYSGKLYIDGRVKLILPYDIILNRLKELSRDKKHGSTGSGFNEAVTRSQYYPYTIRNLQKCNIGILKDIHLEFLESIRQFDLDALDLDEDMKEFIKIMCANQSSQQILHKALELLSTFEIPVEVVDRKFDLSKYNCIFEGSQGLLLDEYSTNYPYVTRTRTGVHNLIDISREYNCVVDVVYYVTRPYVTRHGEDPNFIEEDISDEFNVVDKTNIENPWQGKMKYRKLSLPHIYFGCAEDFIAYKDLYPSSKHEIVITCMDQCKDESKKQIEISKELSHLAITFLRNAWN